ncbi:hypothetical protein ANCDUO_24768 [Ancylostoma duodenale]|uniref:Uncharacterized protein n=1 Tax=Ancylostoma duodenale TaxID=51022 RepID=A0A0C2F9Q8_9BILA|nr:hypothetical protein ANCDUO_24768 [Ancylostoma duodenale]
MDDNSSSPEQISRLESVMEVAEISFECMGGLAYLLNTSVVQFSNWPIADGYITSLNVPANPSAIPKTGIHAFVLSLPFW